MSEMQNPMTINRKSDSLPGHFSFLQASKLLVGVDLFASSARDLEQLLNPLLTSSLLDLCQVRCRSRLSSFPKLRAPVRGYNLRRVSPRFSLLKLSATMTVIISGLRYNILDERFGAMPINFREGGSVSYAASICPGVQCPVVDNLADDIRNIETIFTVLYVPITRPDCDS